MISNKAKAMSSKEKIKEDYNKWRSSEALFVELFPSFSASSPQDNINHSDFEMDDIRSLNVDVKGYKTSAKKGYILLELKNVGGNPGWMSKESKAKFFAFQMEHVFFIFPKENILSFLRDRMPPYEDPVRVNGRKDFENMCYTYQGRPGRKDVFTYVPIEEMKKEIPYITYPY